MSDEQQFPALGDDISQTINRQKAQVDGVLDRFDFVRVKTAMEAIGWRYTGAAVRARSTPARDPVRVFVDLVRKRRWHHVTQAQEDEVRRQFKAVPVAARAAVEGCAQIGTVLDHLLTQGRLKSIPAQRRPG